MKYICVVLCLALLGCSAEEIQEEASPAVAQELPAWEVHYYLVDTQLNQKHQQGLVAKITAADDKEAKNKFIFEMKQKSDSTRYVIVVDKVRLIND
mgnify:CR=1 FL=1